MLDIAPRTTGSSSIVTTIADIEALEKAPYDELVPARNLYHLFAATAQLHSR
jgi:fatty-acyl-CoA synthase